MYLIKVQVLSNVYLKVLKYKILMYLAPCLTMCITATLNYMMVRLKGNVASA